MSHYDDRPLDNMINNILVKIGVNKLLISLDTRALRDVSKKLMVYDYILSDCYQHPDILCKILKEMYGKSYVHMIASI